MSSVSWAIFLALSGGRKSSVRMLCRRSASLIMSTRRSRAMATSILRKFSAWRSSREEKASLPILVTPSTRSAISAPNSRSRSRLGRVRVLEDVVQEPRRHRGHVHLEVHEEAGDLERVGQVGLAGGALLALVGLLGEAVGAGQQVEIGARLVLRDLLDQGLELGQPSPPGLTTDIATNRARFYAVLRPCAHRFLGGHLARRLRPLRLHVVQSTIRAAAI